jgi:hypothetical protein
MGLFPLIGTLNTNGGTNRVSVEMTKQLQAINSKFVNATSQEECEFFVDSLYYWAVGVTAGASPKASPYESIFLLHLSVEPVRCNGWVNYYDGDVTHSFCKRYDDNQTTHLNLSTQELATNRLADDRVMELCKVWRLFNSSSFDTELAANTKLAAIANIRIGAINKQVASNEGTLITKDGDIPETFQVTAIFNETYSIDPA